MLAGQKRRRNLMMVFGAFAIFFTGYPHIWSLYQPYVMEQAGWSQGQASMCFYLALITFVFGNIIGGRIQDKYNPKIVMLIGGGIFAAGILASAFLIIPSPYPMYFSYGVMQGFGQGMIYTTIVSTAQKWFPANTGLASGIVVTANGLCGFFLTPFSKMMFGIGGPRSAFLAIGSAIAVSWILGFIFIKNPDDEYSKAALAEGKKESRKKTESYQYTAKEMIKTKKFYFLMMTMMCGLISYFIVSPVSQIVQTERGISSVIAAGAVMAGSIVNAVARLCLPTMSDKVGRTKCIKGVIIVSIAAMCALVVSKSYITTAAIVLMYGCYGGIMGSFPSLTSSIFGLEHSGENYGIVMAGIVIACLGAPAISNAVSIRGYDVTVTFGIGVIFAAFALLFIILLERELKNDIKSCESKKETRVCQL